MKYSYPSLLAALFLGACGGQPAATTDGTEEATASVSQAVVTPPFNPFDPAICTRSAADSTLLAQFPPGSSQLALGTYELTAWTRQCNTSTGCAGWVSDDEHYFSSPGWPSMNPPKTGMAWLTVTSAGTVDLNLISDRCVSATSGYGMTCDAPLEPKWQQYGAICNNRPVKCGGYSYVSSMQWGGSGGEYPSSSVLYTGNNQLELTGNLGAHCFRLKGSGKTTPDSRGGYTETLVGTQFRW